MKRLVTSFFFLLTMAAIAPSDVAAFDQLTPDYTLLWNRFDYLAASGEFVIGVSARGIIVSKYDPDRRRFEDVGRQFMDLDPVEMKLFGDILAVKNSRDELTFIDVSALPAVTSKGTVAVGGPFADFWLCGNNLYVTRWFDGLTQYRLKDYTSATFADSSLKGILVTQLYEENDTLYVLDQYNGIMRYDLFAPGGLRFVDYLWVPHRPESFLKFNDTFAIALVNSGLMFGQFDLPGSIFDSLMDVPGTRRMYQSDRMIVRVSDRSLDLISKSDLSVSDTITLESVSTIGDISHAGGESLLVLPFATGGFMLFDVEGSDRPTQGFSRPGPVSDLMLYNGTLITGGERNPLDVYSLDTNTPPRLDTTISRDLDNISGFVRTNDSMIVFYSSDINSIVVYSSIDNEEYPFYLEESVATDTLGFSKVTLGDYVPQDSVRIFLIAKDTFYDVYALMEYGELRYVGRWYYTGRIQSFAIHGRYVYTATNKGNLWIHKMNDDFSRSLLGSSATGRTTEGMSVHEGRLWIFDDRNLTILDLGNPAAPVVESVVNLPLAVSDFKFLGDSLYTVGYEGMGIYALDPQQPRLVWSASLKGQLIDTDRQFVAISDGAAVDIIIHPAVKSGTADQPENLPRSFVLGANYPNPFNPVTSIPFELGVSAHVELTVYNSLGRKVADLKNELLPAGVYRVEWDGRNVHDAPVASGVYLYRLKVGDEHDAKKMVLLK